jgi:hypothetical protein
MPWRHDSNSRRHARVVLFALAGFMSAGKNSLADPARKGFTRHRTSVVLPVDEKTGAAELPLRWYGWQILAADGGATGLVLLDAALTDGEPAPALALFFFASPIVHALHGNPGRAAASLGLRALLPFAGGLIGMEASDCGILGGECKGLDVGMVLGFASAVLIDASLLAWQVDDGPAAQTISLRPSLEIGRHGGWLGVAGAL